MSTVDLIVPSGGGLATAKRLLRSIANEGVDFLHIIFVDQGKDERGKNYGGGDWLREQEKEIDNLYVISNADNVPPPAPYNDGLDLSQSFVDKSDYIHFLDDDMEVIDGSYLNQMIVFYEKGNFGLISSEHCYFGPRPIPESGEVPDFGMGAFLFKREIFDKLGFLDERFQFHCSDSDYVQRTKKILKRKIGVLPNSMELLTHMHQLGTRRRFSGTHQPIIDKDWEVFAAKWDDEVKLEFQERTRMDVNERRKAWSKKCLKATE